MHAFTLVLDLSNSWNLDDNKGINVDGTRDFASSIATDIKGGIHILFLNRANEAF